MKINLKKLLIIFMALNFTILQISCKKSTQIITGSTKTQINDAFPSITGIASCYWEYETIVSKKRLSVGPNNYKFYGYISLTKDYYLQISNKYNWKEYNEDVSPDFIKNIRKTIELKVCNEFTETVSTAIFRIIVLDEVGKKIYFYIESN